MKRYSVYLLDLYTLNVYGEPIYTDDLEDAKRLAIDMVRNTNFDEDPIEDKNSFVVAIDDNRYEMSYDWQILAYGLLPYDEVCRISGQNFNGYMQLQDNVISESLTNGISKKQLEQEIMENTTRIINVSKRKVKSLDELIDAIMVDNDYIDCDYGRKEIMWRSEDGKHVLFNVKNPNDDISMIQYKIPADKIKDYLLDFWSKDENIGEMFDDDGNLKHYIVQTFDF